MNSDLAWQISVKRYALLPLCDSTLKAFDEAGQVVVPFFSIDSRMEAGGQVRCLERIGAVEQFRALVFAGANLVQRGLKLGELRSERGCDCLNEGFWEKAVYVHAK